jgi:hypothetical protein
MNFTLKFTIFVQIQIRLKFIMVKLPVPVCIKLAKTPYYMLINGFLKIVSKK